MPLSPERRASMSTTSSRLVGLLASIVFMTGLARGQDFNERYAAWQGRASVGPRMAAQTTPLPEVGGEAEALPSGTPTGGQRILSGIYSAPLHTPDYNNPWS